MLMVTVQIVNKIADLVERKVLSECENLVFVHIVDVYERQKVSLIVGSHAAHLSTLFPVECQLRCNWQQPLQPRRCSRNRICTDGSPNPSI